MQTESVEEMIEKGSDTDSYARSKVVPVYSPSSYSLLNRLRQGGTNDGVTVTEIFIKYWNLPFTSDHLHKLIVTHTPEP